MSCLLTPHRNSFAMRIGTVRNTITEYLGPRNKGWSPEGHAVRLLRFLMPYEIASASAGGTLTGTAYKNGTAAGNIIFQIAVTTTIATTGFGTDTTVNNAGNEVITPSDQVFFTVSHDDTGTINYVHVGLDFEEWYG
jgi:hypothetical protein